MTQDMRQDYAPETAVQPAVEPGAVNRDFLNALLAAVTEMAVLSPRRQADVAVAIRRAGLEANTDTMRRAVDMLSEEGCIERPLHLSDGGILVSVTMRGIEILATTSHRDVVTRMLPPGMR
jgi:hypothetical protein